MIKSENKIELVNINKIIDKSDEKEIIYEIYRREFYKWMENHGFTQNNLRRMFESKRISSIEQNRFNSALKSAKQNIHIEIVDSLLYLEESFVKIKKIVSFLDDDTKSILKHELSAKYKIKIEKNELWKFLDD